MSVNPIFEYQATGAPNSDLPEYGTSQGSRVPLKDVVKDATIIISMPEFSATAPLMGFSQQQQNLRVASMPTVTRAMERTGLAADHHQIAKTCARLAPFFEKANGIMVTFSTGHACYFDISDHKPVLQDNGKLPPDPGKDVLRLRNLPSGEVYVVPNEAVDSRTAGEIPVAVNNEIVVLIVQNNRIVEIVGDSSTVAKMPPEFFEEKAWRSIAEVAIGCNDRAVVSGNVLEDEKAGFHWAYGRSDFLGGTVGPEEFSAPDKVIHQDIVYAKGNPIVCSRLEFIFPGGEKYLVIQDGELSIPEISP